MKPNKTLHSDLRLMRKQMNEINVELAQLLKKRFLLAIKIADLKSKNQLPLRDKKREKYLIQHLEKQFKSPDQKKSAKKILKTLLSETHDLMKKS